MFICWISVLFFIKLSEYILESVQKSPFFYTFHVCCCCSVTEFCSNYSRLHGLQHARLLCPPLSLRVCSNSCSLSQWCYLPFSSFATPFSFCLPSFPASGSSPGSQLFPSGGQNIGASASTSVLPMNIKDWFPLGWTGWIPLLSKRFSWVFSRATVRKHLFFGIQSSYGPTLHPYMTTGKTIALTRWTFVSKVMSLFLVCCQVCDAYLSGSKCLLVSWLLSPSTVIVESKKVKSVTASTFPPSVVMGPDAMVLGFRMLSFRPVFFTLLFHPHQNAP